MQPETLDSCSKDFHPYQLMPVEDNEVLMLRLEGEGNTR